MAYFNTTQETPNTVQEYLNVSNNQKDIVLRTIRRLGKTFSASVVMKNYPVMNTPITSIRRAINTLKNDGVIQETGNRVTGIYGRSELEYKLV